MRDVRRPFSSLGSLSGAAAAWCFSIVAIMVATGAFPSAAFGSSCQADAADEIFLIDSSQSHVAAKVRFFGFATKTASFPKVAGRITLPNGRADGIRLDVAIDASMLKAADGLTTARLRGASFFDVEQFPEVRLHGENFVRTGASAAQVVGTLTARGVSRPVTLKLTFSKQIAAVRRADSLDIRGEMQLDRTQFGMTAYPLIVGRDVTVSLKVHVVPERVDSCRFAGD